jgi:secreted PhoX family phosphatase
MEHDNNISNPSKNRPFQDVLRASMSRRNILKRSAMLSAASFVGTIAGNGLVADTAAAQRSRTRPTPGAGTRSGSAGVNFRPVTIAQGSSDSTVPHISPDYEFDTLIPWGTPIKPGVPEYAGDPVNRTNKVDQAKQIGIGHDGMHFFPEGGVSNTKGILCINHEFGITPHVLGKALPESLEEVTTMEHAHGVSCVAIEKVNGQWQVDIDNPVNRRIHVNTPVEFSGPAAGSDLAGEPRWQRVPGNGQ